MYCPVHTLYTSIVVQSPSCVWLFVTPWTVARQAYLSLTISQFAQVHVHWWCCSAISSSDALFSPSALNLSKHQGLFQWVVSLHHMTKILELQLQHSDSRLISFKTHWFNLLVVQGTFRSLLQHHSLKASILWHSAFFTVQLTQPCMTTGKTIALTI